MFLAAFIVILCDCNRYYIASVWKVKYSKYSYWFMYFLYQHTHTSLRMYEVKNVVLNGLYNAKQKYYAYFNWTYAFIKCDKNIIDEFKIRKYAICHINTPRKMWQMLFAIHDLCFISTWHYISLQLQKTVYFIHWRNEIKIYFCIHDLSQKYWNIYDKTSKVIDLLFHDLIKNSISLKDFSKYFQFIRYAIIVCICCMHVYVS